MKRPTLCWPLLILSSSPAFVLQAEDGRRFLLQAGRSHEEDCDLGDDCTCGATAEGVRDLEEVAAALGYRTEPAATKTVCATCGSDRVQGTAWVELNSGELLEDEPPVERCWCPDCGDDVETREVPNG